VVGRGQAAGVRARTPADTAAAERATEREVGVVAAVLVAGSEKARPPTRPVALDCPAPPGECAVQGGAETTAQLVWVLAPRLPEAEALAQPAMDLLGNRSQLRDDPVRVDAARLSSESHRTASLAVAGLVPDLNGETDLGG
jgi:hypothetical protein